MLYMELNELKEGEMYYISFEKRCDETKGFYLLATEDGKAFGFSDKETAEELVSSYNSFTRVCGRSSWSYSLSCRYTKATKKEIEVCVTKPIALVKFIYHGFTFNGIPLKGIGINRLRSIANSFIMTGN